MTGADFYEDPVHDIDAEKWTLACMMAHASGVEAAAEILDEDSFFRPAHQVIFKALVLLMAAGEPVGAASLRARMIEDKTIGVLGDGGRGLLLAELAGMPAVAAQAASYARIVLRYAGRRALVAAGTRLIQAGHAADMDDLTAVSRGHEILDKVLTAGCGSALDMPGVSADEFCDGGDLNADPLIPGLLYKMERVVVVGLPGSGKSVLALQAGFTAASGVHPFQHHLSFDPLKVLVMDLENPPHLVQRRFRTFRSIAANHPGWDGKNLTLLHKPGGINLTSSRDAYGVAQLIKRSGAQLVVAGPVYKMLSGVKVDLDAYSRVTAFWDKMREDFGVTLWLEHHPPFGSGGRDREMRPEGSNVWEKWPEFGVGLKPASKAHGGGTSLDWTDFRGRREEGRPWPLYITRNPEGGPNGWPWLAQYHARPAPARQVYDDGGVDRRYEVDNDRD